jgi:hypothetical protein
MPRKPRYSIKKYIFLIVLSSTIAFITIVAMLSVLGFDSLAILRIMFIWFPICIFSALYGFYKGLVKHYGLKQSDKLLFKELKRESKNSGVHNRLEKR